MQNQIQLYRKRLFPDEIIHLKDDKILLQSDNLIITKWVTLKKRDDIDHGISAYFMREGYKVSKVYDKNNHLVYWYCDIIETLFRPQDLSYIFTDLLIDVLVYEDGQVRVVDLGEAGDMLELGKLDLKSASKALHITENLLQLIYTGRFSQLQKVILDAEATLCK